VNRAALERPTANRGTGAMPIIGPVQPTVNRTSSNPLEGSPDRTAPTVRETPEPAAPSSPAAPLHPPAPKRLGPLDRPSTRTTEPPLAPQPLETFGHARDPEFPAAADHRGLLDRPAPTHAADPTSAADHQGAPARPTEPPLAAPRHPSLDAAGPRPSPADAPAATSPARPAVSRRQSLEESAAMKLPTATRPSQQRRDLDPPGAYRPGGYEPPSYGSASSLYSPPPEPPWGPDHPWESGSAFEPPAGQHRPDESQPMQAPPPPPIPDAYLQQPTGTYDQLSPGHGYHPGLGDGYGQPTSADPYSTQSPADPYGPQAPASPYGQPPAASGYAPQTPADPHRQHSIPADPGPANSGPADLGPDPATGPTSRRDADAARRETAGPATTRQAIIDLSARKRPRPRT